ncbi:glycosyltransferase [Novosphingobium ovatum]|uniref:glycosyltransferase n=1 Tax=Novosphingobium ovatum TaxID=1908523 RepID=UPI0029FF34DD|nr:glycosyltransferase [Novosphingobium ovatum]
MSIEGVELIETIVEWLQLVERELLLFSLFWFVVGMLDELAIDLVWIALRADKRYHTKRVMPAAATQPLQQRLAIFIACWREDAVIGQTVGHMLRVWQQRDCMIYVGCYCNDPDTIAAVVAHAGMDSRIRVIINPRPGPTTKADCLNRLYRALQDDEARDGFRFGGVILHDSEDMVHGLELHVIDTGLSQVDFVQLPVRAEFLPGAHWIAGHYCDEFVESHCKSLVVRDALGAGLPAAGVSCGFSRDMLDRIADLRRQEGGNGPFAEECFTEDYELGLLIKRMGGRSRFLRRRDIDGNLIGTRSYFPGTLNDAVRQKTRWIHGIALQGWDRLGWQGRFVANGWPCATAARR